VVVTPAAPLTFAVKGGSYATDFTMLAMLRDQNGGPTHKTGPTGLGVSSLVLLSRLGRATSSQPDDPLVVDGRLITPNLGEPMYRRPEAKLGFYFTVVGADPGERLAARLRFFTNGTPSRAPCWSKRP